MFASIIRNRRWAQKESDIVALSHSNLESLRLTVVTIAVRSFDTRLQIDTEEGVRSGSLSI